MPFVVVLTTMMMNFSSTHVFDKFSKQNILFMLACVDFKQNKKKEQRLENALQPALQSLVLVDWNHSNVVINTLLFSIFRLFTVYGYEINEIYYTVFGFRREKSLLCKLCFLRLNINFEEEAIFLKLRKVSSPCRTGNWKLWKEKIEMITHWCQLIMNENWIYVYLLVDMKERIKRWQAWRMLL